MTAPRETTKTIRVSPEVHRVIMDIAATLPGRATADDALRILTAETTVRVPVTEVQLSRWKAAAAAAGVTLAQYVKLCTEASIMSPPSIMIERMYYTVRALAQQAGVTPSMGIQQTTDESTD